MPDKHRAIRPVDPFHEPNWRQLRAQELVRTPGHRTADELVNAYCDFLERGHAGKHHWFLETAVKLRHARNADQRAELEARILARQPIREVAERCGLTVEVVAAYHDLFFDVVDRLSAHDWIMSQVLEAKPADDAVPTRLRGLWRQIGYYGGPLALEPLLAVSRGLPIPDEFLTATGEAREKQQESLRLQLELYIAIELATTPDDWQPVAKMHAELQKRFPESVSKIPAAHWMLLGGMKAKSKKTQKPTAQPTAEKPTAPSPPTRSSISNAILATVLHF